MREVVEVSIGKGWRDIVVSVILKATNVPLTRNLSYKIPSIIKIYKQFFAIIEINYYLVVNLIKA